MTNTIPDLYDHQKETLKFSKKTNKIFDTSDPGTGKTRAHLEIFKKNKKAGKLLVLAPKSLLEAAWGSDIERFYPEFTYSIARATNREKAFNVDVDIYITNIDAVKWLLKQKPQFFKKFGSIIIDESTAYKNRTSARSKAVKKIIQYFKYRSLLTGTPNSNTITDVWHQVYLLDDGHRLGNSFFQFRSAVCTPKQVGPSAQMVKWVDKEDAEIAVTDLIKDISIRHDFNECLDIPENSTQYIGFDLSPTAYDMYKKMQETAILELDKDITAVNAAVLRNKLLQIASGAVYSSEGEYTLIHNGRYELILDLIEAREHSVTFFNWKHQKDELRKAADKRKIRYAILDGSTNDKKRTEIVDAYQAGHFQTIFLHPQTGAHGLTLTRGTATIFCSPIYQADFLKQGKHRIWRSGQTRKTETILIEAHDTVERLVYEKLNHKSVKMTNFLDIIKDANTNSKRNR